MTNNHKLSGVDDKHFFLLMHLPVDGELTDLGWTRLGSSKVLLESRSSLSVSVPPWIHGT